MLNRRQRATPVTPLLLELRATCRASADVAIVHVAVAKIRQLLVVPQVSDLGKGK